MSRNNDGKKLIRDIKNQLTSQVNEYRFYHDHKDAKGPLITPLKDVNNRYIPNRHMYPDSAVMCEDCEEIFDMESISEEDFDYCMFKLTSAVNQMKVLTNFNSDDGGELQDSLANILKFFYKFEHNFKPGYFKMVKQYMGGNKNRNKNNNQRQKGHMGVSSSSFR